MVILSDAFLGHLNEVVDLDAINVPVVPRTMQPLASGGTRLFSGVATYPDGEPATADSDEYIRQYEEMREMRRSRSPSATLSRVWLEQGVRYADDRLRHNPSRGPAARSAFRALPADPHLAHSGRRSWARSRRATRRSSSSRAATGSTPTSWSGCFCAASNGCRSARRPYEPGGHPRRPRQDRHAAHRVVPRCRQAPAKEGAGSGKPGAKAPAKVG